MRPSYNFGPEPHSNEDFKMFTMGKYIWQGTALDIPGAVAFRKEMAFSDSRGGALEKLGSNLANVVTNDERRDWLLVG